MTVSEMIEELLALQRAGHAERQVYVSGENDIRPVEFVLDSEVRNEYESALIGREVNEKIVRIPV